MAGCIVRERLIETQVVERRVSEPIASHDLQILFAEMGVSQGYSGVQCVQFDGDLANIGTRIGLGGVQATGDGVGCGVEAAAHRQRTPDADASGLNDQGLCVDGLGESGNERLERDREEAECYQGQDDSPVLFGHVS